MIRVFLFVGHDLFGQGVASLLCRQTGLVLVGQETDGDRAIECIAALRPDVVVMSHSDDSYEQGADILRLLRNNLVDRVIGLNPDDNMIRVYHSEQVPFRQMQDLAGVILSSPETVVAKEKNRPLTDREADPCRV